MGAAGTGTTFPSLKKGTASSGRTKGRTSKKGAAGPATTVIDIAGGSDALAAKLQQLASAPSGGDGAFRLAAPMGDAGSAPWHGGTEPEEECLKQILKRTPEPETPTPA